MKEIPETPDVAVFVIPASAVVQVLEECAEKGIKSVVVESGGFVEVDEQGAMIENRIIEIARSSGMRILGPNTSGIISTPGKFITTFFPLGRIRRGSVMVAGIAYAGDRGISKVEVSFDDGRSWQQAELKKPLSSNTWALWAFEWFPPSTGGYLILARATDGTGQVQTGVTTYSTESGPDTSPNGATGYGHVATNVVS